MNLPQIIAAVADLPRRRREPDRLLSKAEVATLGLRPIRNNTPLIRRNKPCPCGSGRKFKFCCLKDG